MRPGEKNKPGGRGFGRWRKGEKLTSLVGLKPGDVLLEYSRQFHTENAIRITNVMPQEFQEPGTLVYAMFVNPWRPSENVGAEFSIWHFDVEGSEHDARNGETSLAVWRALEPVTAAKPGRASASEALFRAL